MNEDMDGEDEITKCVGSIDDQILGNEFDDFMYDAAGWSPLVFEMTEFDDFSRTDYYYEWEAGWKEGVAAGYSILLDSYSPNILWSILDAKRIDF